MDEFLALVLLNMVQGIGPIRTKRLLDAFGCASKVFQAPAQKVMEAGRLTPTLAEALVRAPLQLDPDEEIRLARRMGVRILSLYDDEYPALLKNIADPPCILYVKGDFLPCDENALGIVGSRGASLYGLMCARKFGARLCAYGLSIVSGLARGIDTAAHRAALDSGGRTIAVLGSGLARVYPPENEVLFEQIAAAGAVVSQFPLKTPPLAQNFPMRNRIISGLSKGVLVVEASAKSGALITARCALEQGRDVFAIPGEISKSGAAGTNGLIKDGARLVVEPEEVLEELRPVLRTLGREPLRRQTEEVPQEFSIEATEREREILEFLDMQPAHVDSIAQRTGLSIPEILSILVDLELKGVIRQFPGQSFGMNAS